MRFLGLLKKNLNLQFSLHICVLRNPIEASLTCVVMLLKNKPHTLLILMSLGDAKEIERKLDSLHNWIWKLAIAIHFMFAITCINLLYMCVYNRSS